MPLFRSKQDIADLERLTAKVRLLETENHRLERELSMARALSAVTLPAPADEYEPPAGQLPKEIEVAIAARGFNPVGHGMTRSVVRNMLRVHREQDVLRMLDGMGETID